MSSLWLASYIGLWIVVLVLAIIVVGLLRQLGLIQLRLGLDPGALITQEGLERGVEAPDFEAIDVRDGRLAHLSDYRGQRLLLVFLTTTCSACRTVAVHLNSIMREYRDDVATLVVCHGDQAACAEFARQVDLQPPLLADPANAIAERFDVRFTPFAFLLNESGVVLVRGVANTWPQLEALLNEEGSAQKAAWQPA